MGMKFMAAAALATILAGGFTVNAALAADAPAASAP